MCNGRRLKVTCADGKESYEVDLWVNNGGGWWTMTSGNWQCERGDETTTSTSWTVLPESDFRWPISPLCCCYSLSASAWCPPSQKQTFNHSIKQSTNQPTNQSTNQSINQSTNQPTNQLTNQPTKLTHKHTNTQTHKHTNKRKLIWRDGSHMQITVPP